MKQIERQQAQQLVDLSDEDAKAYVRFWHHDQRGVCALHRLLYHWTVHVGIDCVGYRERYCYDSPRVAIAAFDLWDGEGDPIGWHRHPTTGRRINENGEMYVEP